MRLENVHVGIDVDGVLADNLPVSCRIVRERTGVDITPDDISEWNPPIPELDTHFGPLMSQYIHDDPSIYLQMDPVPGARNGLEQLRDAGATITIVTHRDRAHHSITMDWLDTHGFPYDSYATDIDHRVPKSEAGVDLLVDDSPSNLLDVADAGQTGVMMVRETARSGVPTHPRIHVPCESTHSLEHRVQNPACQWEQIPRIVTDVLGE